MLATVRLAKTQNITSIADFIQLAAHFGQSDATWQNGDINYDGSVTIADFIELAAHFGTSYSGESIPISPGDAQQLSAFSANVPEPNCLIAAAIGAFVTGLTRRSLSGRAAGAPAAG